MQPPSPLPPERAAGEPVPPRPRRRMDTVAGHRIHSLEYGGGEAAVVLLHGLAGSSRWWAHNIPALARRHRVLVPDLIGFGRSPRPSRALPGPDAVALVLAEWLERVAAAPAHLVGHSMGGQIAIHLAAAAPERLRRLVLVDAAGVPRPVGIRTLVLFLAGVAPPSSWGDPGFVPVMVGDALKTGPRTLLEATRHILRDDVRPLLPRIVAPTLVVWGERDRLVPVEHARELEEGIPGARRVVLPGAAHNAMVDRPEAFNRLVLEFLEARPEGGGTPAEPTR